MPRISKRPHPSSGTADIFNDLEHTSTKTFLRPQIRAAEDILALTRTMKETWLFGKLDTIGEDERDVKRREKLEEDVKAVKGAMGEGGILDLKK